MSDHDQSLWVLVSCALRTLTDDLTPDEVRKALGEHSEAAYRAGGLTFLETHLERELARDGYVITSPVVTGVVQLARTLTGPRLQVTDAEVIDLQDRPVAVTESVTGCA